jgi:hypothetical protein
MPTTANSLRNIANRLNGPTNQIYDNRGNPVSLPASNISQQIQIGGAYNPGIARTSMPEVTAGTWYDFSGRDGLSILLSVSSPDGTNHVAGYTPPEAFYVLGFDAVDESTGFPKEAGVILGPESYVSNYGIDKISRTRLVMNLVSSQANGTNVSADGNKVQLFFTREAIKGKQNVWGNNTNNLKPTAAGWTNPLHYIINPDNKNDKTGLPKELGDFPYNYNDKFGASYFNDKGPGIGVKDLKLTTPKNKVDGPQNDGINSKKEVSDVFREAKPQEFRVGGLEQYDFLHGLDRLEALDNLESIPNDVYLASFVEVKDHEDPVMFGYDIFINFDTSPLFNGAIIEFIDAYGGVSEEIANRKAVYTNFVNQFKRFFKMNVPSTAPDPNPASDLLIVPVKNDGKKNREMFKTYYLKNLTGLDLLTQGSVTNNNDTVKSMVNYGTDMIKLSLYEDLTINTGYLAMLYKLMTWSRLNGKQLIPENLLRFDCKIVINELRNYNKVIKNNGGLDIYADDMNRYVYSLYDCQFMFDKLSHDDAIDMWNIKTKDDFEISFDYKFSTLNFEKYDPNKPSSIRKWSFDNKKVSPIEYNEDTTAPSLKNYDRISPLQPETSDVVAAELRNIDRQLADAQQATFNETERQIRESSPSTGESPELTDSLEDVKLLERYNSTNNRGPYDRFVNSEETTLERFKRQQKNQDLILSIEDRLSRADLGAYNKQRSLISRSVNNIIHGREQLRVGVENA